MRGKKMKRLVGLVICLVMLFGCAQAERSVELPHSRYVIEVPDWMRYSEADGIAAGGGRDQRGERERSGDSQDQRD